MACEVSGERGRKLLCVVGGFCAMCVSGQFYLIGNVGTYLESYLAVRGDYPPDARWFMSTLIALVFAGAQVGTMMGGYLSGHLRPHLIGLIGLSLLTGGVAISYWTIRVSTVAVIVTFVAVPSVGFGCVYGCPYSALNEHKFRNLGVMYGIVNSGFGGGAVLYNVIMSAFINPENKAPDKVRAQGRHFSQDEILDRVPTSFLLLSGLYAIFLPVAVWGMRPPPPPSPSSSSSSSSSEDKESINGVVLAKSPTSGTASGEKLLLKRESRPGSSGHVLHKSYESIRTQDTAPNVTIETDDGVRGGGEEEEGMNERGGKGGGGRRGLSPRELFYDRTFYVVWIMIFLSNVSSNSVIGYYKELGQTYIQNDILLASLGTFGALVNAMGRPLWGLLIDVSSFQTASVLHLGTTCILLAFWGVTLLWSAWLYYLWTLMLYTSVSAFPVFIVVACKGYFGQDHQMGNLAVIWTALSGSSCLLPFITSLTLANYGWNGLVLLFALAAFGGLLVSMLLPKRLMLVTDLQRSDHLLSPCCRLPVPD